MNDFDYKDIVALTLMGTAGSCHAPSKLVKRAFQIAKEVMDRQKMMEEKKDDTDASPSVSS